jgi:CRP/FNR family transcriptional regulator
MINQILHTLFDKTLLNKIDQDAEVITFSAGEIILQPGKYIKFVPVLLKGSVKIIRVDENGNELFLYYLSEGQSCASSLSAFMNNKKSNIKAIAEKEVEILAIPTDKAMTWFNEFPSWRKFVMQTMESRFEQLIHTVDNIAFTKTDERLLNLLRTKASNLNSKTLQITHQEIANELSSSREVISRLLKQLEKEGLVKLGRNKIEIVE